MRRIRPMSCRRNRRGPPAPPGHRPSEDGWISRPPAAVAAPAPRQASATESHEIALAEALELAGQAANLAALREAMAAYPHCELRRGARNLVFGEGDPKARIMILGEAPDADEDREGRPFVGRPGQMLDRMLAAIGLSRSGPDAEQAVYLANAIVWRPPGDRDPSADEIAMLLPFLRRHIALVDPDILVLMGNTPCAALLGRRGVLRLRGTWEQVEGRPALAMAHPAYLLRNPLAKREAWADLLALKVRVEEK
jgi:uracil-DNA glycosylase family 4